MFRQMDLKGQTQVDTQLKTTHQNTISTVRVYEESNGVVRKFSSKDYPHCRTETMRNLANVPMIASGVDGRVVVWSI